MEMDESKGASDKMSKWLFNVKYAKDEVYCCLTSLDNSHRLTFRLILPFYLIFLI